MKKDPFISQDYTLEMDNTDPNGWGKLSIVIKDKNNKKVGKYKRNYSTNYKNFYPFICNGKKLALISSDYTSTQILDLDTGKIIGGEKGDANGFCPVEFYVPYYSVQRSQIIRKDDSIETTDYVLANDTDSDDSWAADHSFNYLANSIEHGYAPFGFVAGCHWGDDTSWKVQYLDLSKADKGIITRTPYFGYVAMGSNVTLPQALEIWGDYHKEQLSFRIVLDGFRLDTFADVKIDNDIPSVEVCYEDNYIGLWNQLKSQEDKNQLQQLYRKFIDDMHKKFNVPID